MFKVFTNLLIIICVFLSINISAQSTGCGFSSDNGCSITVGIDNFTITGESATSINTIDTNCDQDTTAAPILTIAGSSYNLSIVANSPTTPHYAAIYVDWNNDNDYQDMNEFYDFGSFSGTLNDVLTVPTGQAAGFFNFIVVTIFDSPFFGAPLVQNYCGEDYTFLEFEEYQIEVQALNCTAPTFTFATIDDCANDMFDLVIDVTNNGSASAIIISDLNNQFSDVGLPLSTTTFPFTIGTFVSGTLFNLDVTPNDNPFCITNVGNFTSPCQPPGATCNDALAITFNDCSTNFFGTTIQPNTGSNIAVGGNGAQWFTFTPPSNATIFISSCDGGSTTDLALHQDLTGMGCASLNVTTEFGTPFPCNINAGVGTILQNLNVTAGTTYYIEWGNTFDSNPFNWNIDYECDEEVQGLTGILGADTTTEVILSFIPPTNVSYLLEYGPTGFAPGTGTIVANPMSPYNVTGLMPSVTYDFHVVEDCFNVGTYTSCSTPVTITTSATCIPPDAFAFPICNTTSTFQIELNLNNLGSGGGNTAFDILINGVSNSYSLSATGISLLPTNYPQGTLVDISFVGNNDPTCSVNYTDLTSTNCICFGSFSNDNCITADEIPIINPFGFCDGINATIVTDLSCANPGFESGLNTCDPDNDSSNNHDVFYEFTSPANGNLNITVVNTTNEINIAIYNAICPGAGAPEILCQSNLSVFTNNQINVTNLLPSSTYFMSVWANSSGPNGSGLPQNVEICMEAGPEIAGPDCSTASTINLVTDCTGNIQTFSNLSAIPATVYPSCDLQAPGVAGINYDVWFEFTAPANGSVDIFLDNISTNGYTYYAVYEQDLVNGCVGTELLCNTGFGTQFVVNDNVSNLVPGDTYLLQVWTFENYIGLALNLFDVCLSSASCVPPTFNVIEDCYGTNTFELQIELLDLGIGNPNGFTVFVDEGTGLVNTGITITQANVLTTLTGTSYAAGSTVIVELVGIDDTTCVGMQTIVGDCSCFGNEPINAECVNAIPLTTGVSTIPGNCNNFFTNGPYSNDCATQGIIGLTEFEPINNFALQIGVTDDGWFPSLGGTNYFDQTVWFEIAGTGGVIEIELTTNLANPIIGAQMAVFDACPGGYNINQAIVFTDLVNPNSNGNLISFNSDANTTYYLLVDHSGTINNTGNFNLNVCESPPPCVLNGIISIQSNPCNPQGDGTFFITANFSYEDLADTTLLMFANSVLIDTIAVNPVAPGFTMGFSVGNTITIPDSLLLPGADLELSFEFATASFCNSSETIAFADLPTNCLKTCDDVLNETLNGTISNNVQLCDNESFTIQVEVTNAETAWPVLPTLTLNGAFVSNLTDANNDGIYNATITESNNGCAPITNNYTVTTFCQDFLMTDSVLSIFNFTSTVFPTDIQSFFNIAALPNCETEVTINPICGTNLVLNSPTIQVGDSVGVHEFDYQYTSINNCFNNTGTLLVPFTCFDCPIVSNVNFSATELCNGEQLTITAVVDPPDATNLNIVINDGNGNPIANLFPIAPGSAVYSATITPVNNGCSTVVENYNLAATCTDNNSILNLTAQQINIYPNNIQQFLDILFINDCSASVQVNPLCSTGGVQNLILTSPSIQNANANTIGTFDFTYQFNGAGNGCFNESGVFSIPYDCPNIINPVDDCFLNNAGLVASNLTTVCSGDFVNANTINQNVTNSNVLTYVLHNGSDFVLGNTTYGTSFSGVFTNNGTLPTNVQLCISSVVGGSNGSSIPNPVCDVSNCLPVVFLDPIVITSNGELCNNFTNEFTVSYAVSGGGPAYLPNIHTYDINIAAENLSGITNGQSIISNPISGLAYSIEVVQDGKGCSASFFSDSVICSSLPIELLSFNGFLKDDGNLIKWQVATAQNVSAYKISYSKNAVDFETLTVLNANDNTNQTQTYEYLHSNILSGNYYYKLFTIDFDGNEQLVSNTFLNRKKEEILNVNLQPNPAKDFILLELFSSNNANLVLEIYDSNGKKINKLNFETSIGNNSKNINIADFANGLYFINIISDNYKKVHKFIKE